jgi:hypothetical protein|tara:strand:- start:307 stop:444 length:138 start_codon:yes stop_codon:yes gene_type:complete
MSKTGTERQSEYEQRLRDAGYRRLQLWVREEDAQKVRDFAASLRK